MLFLISIKFSILGPNITEQLNPLVSIGLCPPFSLNDPPTIATSESLKNKPNSPKVQTINGPLFLIFDF